jgi:polysaccharide chain length determinant protein (PEP-CTERM system associated)
MHEVIVQLLRYARGTWRYRWWMLGVAWAVCLVGWAIVARMPDQFKASARVYVDTSSVLRPYLSGIAMNTDDTNRKIFLMTRTLLSRPNLEKVLRMTDLDLRANTEEEKDVLINGLKSKLRFQGTRRENLYTITYEDASPELAKLVVKSLLTIFMEGNLGEVRKDQDSARQFIEKQIAEYDRLILQTQEKLLRFKQRNMDLLPDEKGGYYERLRKLQAEHEKATLDLAIAKDRLSAVKGQMEGETPTFGLSPSTNIASAIQINTSSYDNRIRGLESRLDGMLIKYTDRHPDVVSTRAAIAKLERERRQYVEKAKRAVASGSPDEAPEGFDIDRNPVYQQMQINLTNLESDVAAKERIVAEYSTRLKKLQTSVDKAFQLQGEQQEMLRVIQSTQKNRAVLVSRLESAELGRKASTSTEAVRFRVIDPPRVPASPSGPNRVMLSSGVLLGGLLAGLALAFLMSQFRPTYDERQTMVDSLGLPVLGSVNMVWTSDQIRARKTRNVSFVFTLTGLLVIFGVVLVLYQFNIDLLPRLAQSLNLT